MKLSLSCRDVGSPCDGHVSGNSIEEIVQEAQRHVMEVHGYTSEEVMAPDFVDVIRGAIRQSARPQALRTIKLAV